MLSDLLQKMTIALIMMLVSIPALLVIFIYNLVDYIKNIKDYEKKNDHVLNDWVFSNNPEILLQNKEVSELKKDLLDKQKKYTEKLFECRKKAHKSEVYYRNKINKIQDILEKL